jgi:hypothetical protein
MDEHRVATRQRVLKAGTIEFGGSKIDCLIRNISATGAAIEVKSPLWFPDTFVLVTTADGGSRHCHIVWRREKRIGVAFDD